MFGDDGLSIAPQLLSIVQLEIKFPMLTHHISDGSDNLQKRRQRGSVKKSDGTRIRVQTKGGGGGGGGGGGAARRGGKRLELTNSTVSLKSWLCMCIPSSAMHW